jgi:hypothetical protein
MVAVEVATPPGVVVTGSKLKLLGIRSIVKEAQAEKLASNKQPSIKVPVVALPQLPGAVSAHFVLTVWLVATDVGPSEKEPAPTSKSKQPSDERVVGSPSQRKVLVTPMVVGIVGGVGLGKGGLEIGAESVVLALTTCPTLSVAVSVT